VFEKPLKNIFCLLAITKIVLGEVVKEMFQGGDKPCEIIFYLLGSKKRFGRCRGSDVVSRVMAVRTYILPSGRLKIRLWLSR
jgi:hypothetical protein